MDKEETKDECNEKDPLLELYLPFKIASSHTLCKTSEESFDSLHPDDNGKDNLEEVENKIDQALKHFEKDEYEEARELFLSSVELSIVAKYYISIMHYDGLGLTSDHAKAVTLMKEVIDSKVLNHERLIHCAEYNIGRAYYEGFGVKQSDVEAEKWWLRAAHNGDEGGCVKSQTILAMFYSRMGEETFDLKKAHFWHQEATANGSLESQTALGMMYEHGMGISKSEEHAFKCLKSAALRGSVYAMGNLALKYYQYKLYRNAFEIAKKVSVVEDFSSVSRQTDCLEAYIRKGVALGCFIYGRCLFNSIAEVPEHTPGMWYSKACQADLDVGQQMQDLVTAGKI